MGSQDFQGIGFYQHPLGFAQATIQREGRYALRLHIWPDMVRYDQLLYWPLHTHRFDLVSVVIAGEITNNVYCVEKTHGPSHFCISNIGYDAEGSVLTATGEEVSFILKTSERVLAQNGYAVAAGVFHETIVPKQEFAATLAVTRDAPTNMPIFTIGQMGCGSRYRYVRSELDAREKAAIIWRLLRFVAPQS